MHKVKSEKVKLTCYIAFDGDKHYLAEKTSDRRVVPMYIDEEGKDKWELFRLAMIVRAEQGRGSLYHKDSEDGCVIEGDRIMAGEGSVFQDIDGVEWNMDDDKLVFIDINDNLNLQEDI